LQQQSKFSVNGTQTPLDATNRSCDPCQVGSDALTGMLPLTEQGIITH